MKTMIKTALAATMILPTASYAGGHEATEAGAPPPGPPPAIVSQINLGQAGLLPSLFSPAQYGLSNTRGGEDATRIGFATSPVGVADGYTHDDTTIVLGLTGRMLIADATSYLTFGVGILNETEADSLTDTETSIPRISLGYQNFANPNAAYTVELTYAERETKDVASGNVDSTREYLDLRLGYARILNDDWGVTAQAVYGSGDLVRNLPGPTGIITTVDQQIFTYAQVEFVGNFTADSVGFVPDGWVLHPAFGASFHSVNSKFATGEQTSNQGSVWAKGTLVQPGPPGTWSPNFTLGIEHVYLHEADAFIDEDTYAILGVGATHLAPSGNAFNVSFESRQGLNGNRSYNTLAANYTINF